jgi:hypothetical protein
MKHHHLCINEPQFSAEIPKELAERLVVAGKIELCHGKHSEAGPDDLIYHPCDDYVIDTTQIEKLLDWRPEWMSKSTF